MTKSMKERIEELGKIAIPSPYDSERFKIGSYGTVIEAEEKVARRALSIIKELQEENKKLKEEGRACKECGGVTNFKTNTRTTSCYNCFDD